MTVSPQNSTNINGHPPGVHKRIKRRRPPSYESPVTSQTPPSSAASTTSPPGTQWHARWLIESFFCSKVLGSGGSRSRNMRETCREAGIGARITMHQPGLEFRVFICSGSALSISKLAGLVVKAIYDEPEGERSDETSKHYDLKLLVPQIIIPPLAGTNDTNLRDIEERSHAELSYESTTLPGSDEVVSHIFGVADAIQIALYYTIETMKQIVNLDKQALVLPKSPFEPAPGPRLKFEKGRASDYATRNYNDSFDRRSLVGSGSGSHSGSYSGSHSGSYSGSHSVYSYSASSNSLQNSGHNPPIHHDGDKSKSASISQSSLSVNSSQSESSNFKGTSSSSDGETINKGLDAEDPLEKKRLTLPPLAEDPLLPEAIFMAYDIARESQRKQLRQVIQIGGQLKGSSSDLDLLIENIHRVTECRAELDTGGKIDHFATYLDDDEDYTSKNVSLVVEGAPEENMSALYLIHRYVKQQKKLMSQ